MPVPTAITDLSTTAASNYPQGTDSPSTLDDVQRAHGAFIRQLQTGAVATTANVTGGTINGATVGATTPSTGAFTTLSASTSVTVGAGASVESLSVRQGNAYVLRTGGAKLRLADQINEVSVESFPNGGNSDLHLKVAGSTVGAFSSTGLAVTGALSATGALTALNGTFRRTDDVNQYAYAQFADAAAASASNLTWGIGKPNGANTFAIWSFDGSSISTKATLDTSGNMALGTAPSAWSGYSAMQLGVTGFIAGRPANEVVTVGSNAYNNGSWRYTASGNTATLYQQDSGTHKWYTAPSGTAGDAISFGDPKMTLDASGNWLVGQTASGLQQIGMMVSGSGYTWINLSHPNATSGGSPYVNFGYNAGIIGSITQNGTTAVAYNTTSDHRLKENVRPANAGRFMEIEFVDFEWVDGRHDCGVIAHQLQSVYPDLVIGEKDATKVRTVEITPAVPEVKDEDGNVITEAVPAVTEEQTFPVYQQVNYIGLIGRMGTRIQQLQRTVDAQAEMLAAMEARLAALEAA